MKPQEKGRLIFGFVSKKSIKRFIVILYVTVPLLLFAVGFSAWTILGHDIQNNDSGNFIASGIINSYDYITIKGDGLNTISLYPTGFVDDSGNIQSAATIEISYDVNLDKCRELLSEGNTQNLYADFTLMFLGGESYEEFFNKLSCDVSEATQTAATNYITSKTDKTTSSAHTVSLVLTPHLSGDSSVTLKFIYTLSPDAVDYQTLYAEMVNNSLKLMADVRITDIAPN